MATKKATVPPQAPPLASLTDLSSITLDFQEDTATIQVFTVIGAPGVGTLGTYELEIVDDGITKSGHTMSPTLRAAIQRVGRLALVEVNKSLEGKAGPVPCTTCRGACCYRYDAVHLTRDDVAMLSKKGHKEYTLYPEPTLSDHVGELKKKPRTLSGTREEGACVYLRDTGCSIYEDRPRVCREYSPWTCGDAYEPDARKVAGKVRLRVL